MPVYPGYTPQNGVFMLALDVTFFRPAAEYKEVVDTLLDVVKSAAPVEGISAVLVPGECELLCRVERERDGVQIDDETWSEIQRAAAKFNVRITDFT